MMKQRSLQEILERIGEVEDAFKRDYGRGYSMMSEDLREYASLYNLCINTFEECKTPLCPLSHTKLLYEVCLQVIDDFERMKIKNRGKPYYAPFIEILRDVVNRGFKDIISKIQKEVTE